MGHNERKSFHMVSSKSEQVGQLALNSAAAGQFTLSMNV